MQKWNEKTRIHLYYPSVITPMYLHVTNVFVYNLYITIFGRVVVCTRMLLVCTRMLLVCYSYVPICYSYVLVCYSYVTPMYRTLLVWCSYVLVCYSYVLMWFCSHNLRKQIVEKSSDIILCLFDFVKATKCRDSSEFSKYLQNVLAKVLPPISIFIGKRKKKCRARNDLGTSLSLQCYSGLLSSGFLCKVA